VVALTAGAGNEASSLPPAGSSATSLVASKFRPFTPLIEFMRIAFSSVAVVAVALTFVASPAVAAEPVPHAKMSERHREVLNRLPVRHEDWEY
jgi:hypothetical protein